MATFKDSAGADWDVRLKFGQLATLREKHGIDTKSNTKEFFASLAAVCGDAERLYLLLVLLCADEMAKRKIDAEAFAMLLDGEAIRQASTAVADAVVSFCQGPDAGKSSAEAIRAGMMTIDVKVAKAIRAVTPTLISKLSGGDGPASSESTPATVASVN